MIYILIGILLLLLITSKNNVEAFEGQVVDETEVVDETAVIDETVVVDETPVVDEEVQVYSELDDSNKSVYKNYLVDGIMVVSIILLSVILIYSIVQIVQKMSKNKRFKLSNINVSYEKALKSIGKKKIIKMKK